MKAVLLTLVLASFSWSAAAQSSRPGADEVGDTIAALEKAIKEKVKPDIKHGVSVLGDKFAGAKKEQQKTILKLDAQVLEQADQELRNAAVEAIARTDADGCPILIKELDSQANEKNTGYYELVIKSLGKLKDPKTGLERLLKLLKHHTIDFVAAATEALANYKEAALETKKQIFDEIIKIYSSVSGAATSNTAQRDTTAKNKLAKLQPAADETLKTLTGKELRGAPEWLRWFNDTGRKATKW